jgi:hypothetical protein
MMRVGFSIRIFERHRAATKTASMLVSTRSRAAQKNRDKKSNPMTLSAIQIALTSASLHRGCHWPSSAAERQFNQRLAAAITTMKIDIAAIPPNGVSSIGNVKRNSLVDSTQTIWRLT